MPNIITRRRRLKVFISYPATDGLQIARQANAILCQEKHKTWFYEQHRTLGAWVWREISDRVVNKSDLLLYICTSSSWRSYGQSEEIGYALCNRVKILAVKIDGAPLPVELTNRTYKSLDSDRFTADFQLIARGLDDTIQRIQKLTKGIKAKVEARSLLKR